MLKRYIFIIDIFAYSEYLDLDEFKLNLCLQISGFVCSFPGENLKIQIAAHNVKNIYRYSNEYHSLLSIFSQKEETYSSSSVS